MRGVVGVAAALTRLHCAATAAAAAIMATAAAAATAAAHLRSHSSSFGWTGLDRRSVARGGDPAKPPGPWVKPSHRSDCVG